MFEQRNWTDIMADAQNTRDRRAAERRRLGIGQADWYPERSVGGGERYLAEVTSSVADREAQRIGYRPKLAGFSYGPDFAKRHRIRIDRISQDERRTLASLFDGEPVEESESVYGARFDRDYRSDAQLSADRAAREQPGEETPGHGLLSSDDEISAETES